MPKAFFNKERPPIPSTREEEKQDTVLIFGRRDYGHSSPIFFVLKKNNHPLKIGELAYHESALWGGDCTLHEVFQRK